MKTGRLKTLDLAERKSPRERLEQRHSHGEYFRALRDRFRPEAFRRQIAGRARARRDGEQLRHAAKIHQLELNLVVPRKHEDVLRLDVTVHEIKPEQMLRRGEQKLRQRDGLVRREHARPEQHFQAGRLNELHGVKPAGGPLRRERAREKSALVQALRVPGLPDEKIEHLLACAGFHRRKLERKTLFTPCGEPDAVAVTECFHQDEAVNDFSFAQRFRDFQRQFFHGAKFAGFFHFEHNRAHVVKPFRSRFFPRGTHDRAGAAALPQLRGQRLLIQDVGNSVGAQQRDVAVLERRLEQVRLNFRLQADGLVEDVLQAGALPRVIARELREPAVARQINT